MATITLYEPHPKQAEVHRSPSRYKVLNWGRQTGKSNFAINYTFLKALQKQGRYFIIAPTYRQAKEIYWKQYLSQLPEELIESVNNNELTITLKHIQDPDNGIFHDPKAPASTIELKGCDDADKLRGMKAQGVVFDEFAFAADGLQKWEMIFEPMLLTTEGWAMFISTPNGFNHFYEIANRAQQGGDWFYSHATPYDNPYVNDAELERIKNERSEDNFYQEYMAEFRKMEGLVYREFKREIHVIEPNDPRIPIHAVNVAGLDPGFDHPFAAVYCKIDSDDNWFVTDSFKVRQQTTDNILRMHQDRMAGTHFVAQVMDSARPETIADWNAKGIPVISARKGKDSVKRGIERIANRLRPRVQLTGKPQPKLYVTSNNAELIEEFERYRRGLPQPGREKGMEEPIKEHDDLLDALRYIESFMAENPNQDYIFPENDLPEWV
jgi:phage terminase large subunit